MLQEKNTKLHHLIISCHCFFLYPLKTSENQRLFDVLKRVKKETRVMKWANSNKNAASHRYSTAKESPQGKIHKIFEENTLVLLLITFELS